MANRISKLILFGIFGFFLYAVGIRLYNLYYPLTVSSSETASVLSQEFGEVQKFSIINSARLCSKDCLYFFETAELKLDGLTEQTSCERFIPDSIKNLSWWASLDKLEKKCWAYIGPKTVSDKMIWKKLGATTNLVYIAQG